MAMSGTAKLGLSVGIGSLSTVATDGAIRYFGNPVNDDGKENWYYKYSSLLGAVPGLAAGGVLWKTWGKEEGLVCGLAAIGTALAIPAREFVMQKKSERAVDVIRRLEGQRQRELQAA